MGALTPIQRQRRSRVETLIRIAEPGLNLVLSAGELLSRAVQRGADDYYPPQRGTLPPSSSSSRRTPSNRPRGAAS
jgi:hypothetical protein